MIARRNRLAADERAETPSLEMIILLLRNMSEVCTQLVAKFPELDSDSPINGGDAIVRLGPIREQAKDTLTLLAKYKT